MEVLLAVVVFSIVLAAINVVFYGAVRLRNKTAAALEAAVPQQHALAIIKRDLANIVLPGGTLFGPLQTTASFGSQTNQSSQSGQSGQPASSVGARPAAASNPNLGLGASSQGQASAEFYTATGLIGDASPWGEVQKVSYYLAQPTNNVVGRDLIRSVTRNLLPTLAEQPEDQWLMSGVESIFFTFYDGTQWGDSWDSTTQPTQLPLAIKVTIQLAPEENERVLPAPIELVVPLPTQASTNQTAQTSQTSGGTP